MEEESRQWRNALSEYGKVSFTVHIVDESMAFPDE